MRVPNDVAAAFDGRLRSLGTERQNALALAVRCVSELGDPALRAALKPAWVALTRIPAVRARMLSSGILMAARSHLECPGSNCPIPALRVDTPPAPPADNPRAKLITLLELKPKASDEDILAAVQAILDAAKGGPPPPLAEEHYSAARRSTPPTKAGCGGTCAERATADKLRAAGRQAATKRSTPARPACTRETLCRHLGLREGTSPYEIRRHAKNVVSGVRTLGSSAERIAALGTHLGAPTGSSADHVMAIVWTLTAPRGTTTNPYLTRLAAKQTRAR